MSCPARGKSVPHIVAERVMCGKTIKYVLSLVQTMVYYQSHISSKSSSNKIIVMRFETLPIYTQGFQPLGVSNFSQQTVFERTLRGAGRGAVEKRGKEDFGVVL